MPDPKLPARALRAIMVADVKGYTAMMAEDEPGTLARMQSLLAQVFEPTLKSHAGRNFKNAGDAVLAEFPSTVKAFECAVAIQKAQHERNATLPTAHQMRLRVGLCHDDVIHDHGDVFGNGVNTAARLQTFSPVGGICMSEAFWDTVHNAVNFRAIDFGEHHPKNLKKPFRIFAAILPWEPTPIPPSTQPNPGEPAEDWVLLGSQGMAGVVQLSLHQPRKGNGEETYLLDATLRFGIATPVVEVDGQEHQLRIALPTGTARVALASPAYQPAKDSWIGQRTQHDHFSSDPVDGVDVIGPTRGNDTALRGDPLGEDHLVTIEPAGTGTKAEVEVGVFAFAHEVAIASKGAATPTPNRKAVLDAVLCGNRPKDPEGRIQLAQSRMRRRPPVTDAT